MIGAVPEPARLQRPTARFLFAHPAHFVALGFGAGLAPVAPGTAGTLVAIPIAWALAAWTSSVVFVMVIIAALLGGAWASQRTGAALGAADHGSIVIDEIAAFLLMLFLVGLSPQRVALAFVLFRIFDIVKPPPIRAVDARFKSGVGVMADDLIAAVFALVVFAIVVRLTGWPR
jgi:phosphatidylglycerophosphatase A